MKLINKVDVVDGGYYMVYNPRYNCVFIIKAVDLKRNNSYCYMIIISSRVLRTFVIDSLGGLKSQKEYDDSGVFNDMPMVGSDIVYGLTDDEVLHYVVAETV